MYFLKSILFILLTLLTQIGGLAYLLALAASRLLNKRSALITCALFIPIYAAATSLSQFIAPAFGRVPLPCFAGSDENLVVRSPLYCILNRHYVTPQMRNAATAFSAHMAKTFPGTITLALDANFPFIDGFPLLPHLSHDDGRKLDLAFYYADQTTYLPAQTRSPIGYFAFEEPLDTEPQPCRDRYDWLTLRWDFAYLQHLFPSYSLEAKRMSEAIRWLANEGEQYGVEKLFVEPHLAERLGVTGDKVRFQGCRAARHDDHLHFQISK
ncbi:MAG: hypothetical protein ACRCU5_16535 [Rhizobiaceae bacterium]